MPQAQLPKLQRQSHQRQCAKFLRFVFTPLSYFHGDNAHRAAQGGSKQCHQSDWACADNRHIITWSNVALLNCADNRGEWLNQGAHLV